MAGQLLVPAKYRYASYTVRDPSGTLDFHHQEALSPPRKTSVAVDMARTRPMRRPWAWPLVIQPAAGLVIRSLQRQNGKLARIKPGGGGRAKSNNGREKKGAADFSNRHVQYGEHYGASPWACREASTFAACMYCIHRIFGDVFQRARPFPATCACMWHVSIPSLALTLPW